MIIVEVCLAVLTTLFSVAELFAFLYQSFFPQYVDITDSERKLLGVRDGEPGFRKSPQATPQSTPSRGIKFSPTSYNPNTQISPNISLRYNSIFSSLFLTLPMHRDVRVFSHSDIMR